LTERHNGNSWDKNGRYFSGGLLRSCFDNPELTPKREFLEDSKELTLDLLILDLDDGDGPQGDQGNNQFSSVFNLTSPAFTSIFFKARLAAWQF